MRKIFTLVAALSLASAMLAGDAVKPNFTGKWFANTEKSTIASPAKPALVSLAIEHKGTTVHFTRVMKVNGADVTTDFTATTDGKDATVNGTVFSFWYIENTLVQLEIGPDATTRTNYTLEANGKALTVEINYVNPPADADTYTMEKTPAPLSTTHY